MAGCAAGREKAGPSIPPAPTREDVATIEPPLPAKKAPDKSASSPRPRSSAANATRSRAALPALIGADAKWTAYGRTLVVGSGNASARQPVPLFRQAGTLAAVRAAISDSPSQPEAEFRNGILMLRFDRGSNEEIATVVNKTLSVTGNRTLQVSLNP